MKAFKCDRCLRFYEGLPFVIKVDEGLDLTRFGERDSWEFCTNCRDRFKEALNYLLENPG